MNIKRAFLTVSAVLMLPAAALAQETLTFDTDLDFANDGEGSAVATLTCNTGVPLTQPFDISDDEGVVFVINEVTIDEDTWCEITVTSVDGYESAEATANGDDTGDTCYYTGGEACAELGVDNTCTFSLEPIGFVYTINKEWQTFNGSLDFEGFEDLDYELEGTCYNVRANPDDTDSLDSASFDCGYTGTGPASCSSPTWYADPDGGTYCVGEEDIEDSAVEQDNGCASDTDFEIGGATEGECLIVNTVFFEGIPTLSQYGLAIMALLMLGVGYVGFRRFV